MSLKQFGSSLPDLNNPKLETPQDVPSRAQSVVCTSMKRSTRNTGITWKMRENLEIDFWQIVTKAKKILHNIDLTEGIDVEESAKQCVEDLQEKYEQIRTALKIVPADIRQAVDRYSYDLKQLQRGTSEDEESQRSSTKSSSTSTTSSKRALLVAQTASIRAKMEARRQEEKTRIELARIEAVEIARRAEFDAEMKAKQEELKTQELESQLKRTETELKVLDEEMEQPYTSLPRIKLSSEHRYCSPPHSNRGHDSVEDPHNTTDLKQLVNAFNQSINRNRLPPPDPGKFSGDPLRYPAWKAAFSTLVESRDIPANEKLHYLQAYLTGEAKELIEGLFYFGNEDAYQSAWRQLQKRYGNDFIISETFRKKLHQWPEINNIDNKGLRKFADFLAQCAVAIDQVPGLQILNDCHENKKIVEKLPRWGRREWSRHVADCDLQQYPKFKEFAKFVTKIADRVNNPILADVQESSSKPSHHNKRNSGGQARTLQTSSSSAATGNTTPGAHTHKGCQFCKLENHILHNCRKFRALTPAERSIHLRKNGMCYGCLNFGHKSKDCKHKSKCDSCGGKHPTCLHGDYKILHPTENNIEEVTSMKSNTSGCYKQMSSMIVPVYLSSDRNPDEEYMVYAMLDSQSDSTFILEDTVAKLDVKFSPATLKIRTMNSATISSCKKYSGLRVRGLESSEIITLPPSYSRSFIPSNKENIPTRNTTQKWEHLKTLNNSVPPLQNCEIGLLIGFNCPQALAPLQVIMGGPTEPFAQRTALGWSIVGRTLTDAEDDVASNVLVRRVPEELMTNEHTNEVHFVCRTEVKDITTSEIIKALEADFVGEAEETSKISQEDLRFLKVIEDGVHKDEKGYYEMPLPFKSDQPQLPNNRALAEKRLSQLKRKFSQNKQYAEDYCKFMNDILTQSEAEEVENPSSPCWYIPHHGIYHPKKNKIRVVFDCSAQYQGTSLNQHLLQGPDLMNTLIGVLCRFRQKPIAIISDIERMFHQFKVRPEDRNYLCFLWWKNGDTSKNPTTYRMKVHLFGATSSPGCALYGLKKLAADSKEFSEEVVNFLTRDFYVDDGMTSCDTPDNAKELVEGARAACATANIRLHKFLSNSREVMESIPPSERNKEISTVSLNFGDLPIERPLGVQWCAESDQFQFRISVPDKPFTRRGILSTVASIYDPLGCLAPFVLVGKRILQTMCKENCSWDESLPENLRPQWECWLADLPKFGSLEVPRCYVPPDFGTVKYRELHHFSDASMVGYGQCSYLRTVNTDGEVSCCLVIGKARVAPVKPTTVPRLELNAAVTSAKMSRILKTELTYPDIKEYFWTDSKIVLGYIQNDARKFHIFVSNRVQTIRNVSNPEQWFYIASDENPADQASRGATATELINSNWFSGPQFLWHKDIQLPEPVLSDIMRDDPEVKRTIVNTTQTNQGTILKRLEKFSDWTKAVLAIMTIKCRIQDRKDTPQEQNRKEAEITIWKLQQAEAFQEEIEILKKHKPLPKGNRLENLDPFIDAEGLLRVGGRLRRAKLSQEIKHPIILPRSGHMIQLLIRYCHQCVAHQGRGFTTNELRNRGYWILGCSRAVSSLIRQCVTCRKLRGRPQLQKMADLPTDRLESCAPFTYCGLDCFGPFLVKEGRKEIKRYGCIATCMASRAVHIELLDDMTSDAFINVLRCIIAIRGPIRTVRCDQGTNFIGAKRELKEALKEIEEKKIRDFLSQNHCDFIFNSPHSSHMGGVWERHIRTTRSILNTLLDKHGSFDSSTLRTFFYEAMAIINSRPLTAQNLNDPCGPEPLTPNHLLTTNSKIILPPPGNFVREDLYLRKRWRRVQYLVNEFWSRWRKEYLLMQQSRSKWHHETRNIKIGDIVVLHEEEIRGHWILAKVIETILDADGLVRRVKLLLATSNLKKNGKRCGEPTILERPIHKLTVLIESEC